MSVDQIALVDAKKMLFKAKDKINLLIRRNSDEDEGEFDDDLDQQDCSQSQMAFNGSKQSNGDRMLNRCA